MRSIERFHFQWPWLLEWSLKVTTFFNVKQLENGWHLLVCWVLVLVVIPECVSPVSIAVVGPSSSTVDEAGDCASVTARNTRRLRLASPSWAHGWPKPSSSCSARRITSSSISAISVGSPCHCRGVSTLDVLSRPAWNGGHLLTSTGGSYRRWERQRVDQPTASPPSHCTVSASERLIQISTYGQIQFRSDYPTGFLSAVRIEVSTSVP